MTFSRQTGFEPEHLPAPEADQSTLTADHGAVAPADVYRLAFEACPFGMAIIESDGAIARVNAEIGRIFGYDSEDLVGRFSDLLVPMRLRGRGLLQAAPAPHEANIRQVGARGDLYGLRSDGSQFPLEASVARLRTPSRDLALAVIADMSDRQRMEDLKHDFVSTASHELRTPLTSIAGSLALLLREPGEPLTPMASRLLKIAHDNSQRLVRLLNDVLDIEKIESGRISLTPQRIALTPFLEQVSEANLPYAGSCGVTIIVDAANGPQEIDTDADRLAQIVTNLLSNAIRFSPKGGEIVVSTEWREGLARISVRDHGPGVPPDFKPRVFEKFAQADAVFGPKTGSGLGLNIVQQLAIRLGGRASFDDAPGGGAIFHVDLPLRDRRHAGMENAAE
jgi:PAS domain S-box-containing protein